MSDRRGLVIAHRAADLLELEGLRHGPFETANLDVELHQKGGLFVERGRE
jgi:hypothetical protein